MNHDSHDPIMQIVVNPMNPVLVSGAKMNFSFTSLEHKDFAAIANAPTL